MTFINFFIYFSILSSGFAFAQNNGQDDYASSETISFKDLSLLVKKTNKFIGQKIEVFNPSDERLFPQNIPFLILQQNEDGTGELEELVATTHLTGKQSLEYVKQWQSENQITSVRLTDLSSTLPCPQNGILCHTEPLYGLSQILRFAHGKGYYERFGAIPNEDNESKNRDYRTIAEFVHSYVTSAKLIESLQPLTDPIPNSMPFIQKLKKFVDHTHLEPTDRISDVFNRITSGANQNTEAHRLYHEFLNCMVSHKDSLFNDLLIHMLKHKEKYDSELLRECAKLLYYSVFEDLEILKENLVEMGIDVEFETENELENYILKNMHHIGEIYINSENGEEEEKKFTGDSPLIFLSSLKIHLECRKKNFLQDSFFISGPLEEAYLMAKQHVAKDENFPQEDEEIDQADYDDESLFSYTAKTARELMDGEKTSADFPEGAFFMLWLLSKASLEKFTQFAFVL